MENRRGQNWHYSELACRSRIEEEKEANESWFVKSAPKEATGKETVLESFQSERKLHFCESQSLQLTVKVN
jgi:hypothetical protein